MLFDPKWNIEAPAEIQLEDWQKLLLKAAEVLERDGWIRHAYHAEGAHCAVGALQVARRELNIPVGSDAKKLAYTNFRRTIYGRLIGSIPHWNDAEWRTKDDVINAFKEAAHVI